MTQKVRYCPVCQHQRIFDRIGREWYCGKCGGRYESPKTKWVVAAVGLVLAAAVALYATFR
jgi:ribosomal protein L37AE/L43A